MYDVLIFILLAALALLVQDEELLRKYSSVYATGGEMQWDVSGDTMHIK